MYVHVVPGPGRVLQRGYRRLLARGRDGEDEQQAMQTLRPESAGLVADTEVGCKRSLEARARNGSADWSWSWR